MGKWIAIALLAVFAPATGYYFIYTFSAPENQPVAPPRIEASNIDIEFVEDPPDTHQVRDTEPVVVPRPASTASTDPTGLTEEKQGQTVPQTNSFTIVGEALDAFSGEPVPDVEVHAIVWDDTLFRAQSGLDFKGAPSVTTDEAGHFELGGLQALTYALMTEHPTHVMTQPAMKYVIARRFGEQLVTLNMVEGGYVAGAASMMDFPLAHQEIVLKYKEDSSSELRTKTDAYGTYMFAGLRSGSAVVSTDVSSLGSPEQMAIRTRIEHGQITTVDLRFGGLDAAIFGRVYPFEPDKQYVVTAQATNEEIDTLVHVADVEADGSFFFPSLPSGDYRVTVEAHKRMHPKRTLRALVRTEQGKVATHDFYFYSGYGAEGYVSNLQPGETLSVIATKTVRAPEISQRILRLIRKASTTYYADVDASGGFWFEYLEPGTYMVVAEGAKDRIGIATINIEPDRYSQLRRLEPGEEIGLTLLDFRAAPGAM